MLFTCSSISQCVRVHRDIKIEKHMRDSSAESARQKNKVMVWMGACQGVGGGGLHNSHVGRGGQHDWGATCWRPEVKGVKLAVNTIYNHWRFEDVWLDR